MAGFLSRGGQPRPPRARLNGLLQRIDVDGEKLVVDLLVGADGTDFVERLVELFAQVIVLLANGDTDTIADKLLVGNRLADEFAAALAIGVLGHPVE